MDVSYTEGVSQYLSFQLGNELFAIEVAHVREVLELIKITSVPGAPEFLKGIINVRGGVVPVMNLHCRLGLFESEKGVNTRIIVTELPLGDENIVLGIIADSVKEVLDLKEEDIEEPPRIGNKFNTNFTKGITNRDDDFIIILDIESIISNDNSKTDQGVFDLIDDTMEKERTFN
ncbi:MAG: chemotaxis protein CheW [Desulfobacteraceae bacterium]